MSARYSFIEHLAHSVLFSRCHDGAIISMFKAATAYFDASGHPDQHNVLTVGGFLSRVDKWGRFEDEWAEILHEYGISALHMTDYVSGRGEFAKFKGNTPLRNRLQLQLSECIKKNTNKSIRATLILPDYRAVNKHFKLQEKIGPPYVVCSMMCLIETLEWARRKKCDDTLLCYFEDGDKDKGEFKKKSEGMLPPPRLQFLQKDGINAFQAADFVAWKTKANVEKWLSESYHPDQRHDLARSLGSVGAIPTEAKVLTFEGLIGICLYLGVERR